LKKAIILVDPIISFEYDQLTEERLDKFLVSRLPDYSRSRIQKLIRDGRVQVNNKIPEKTGVLLDYGNIIRIDIPPVESTEIIPEKIDLKIVFENEDLLVVDKPAGMVVHPAFGHHQGTLVNAVLGHDPMLDGIGGEQRPGIVHRLDKDTSGLIIIAKNDFSHRWLSNQFKERKVRKIYLTLVDGHPPTPQGRIEAPIGRDPSNRKKMAIVSPEKGRQSISEYESLERFVQFELVEVHPITGRTHQIRLHMEFLGCPVVGDTLYGHHHSSLPINRFFLHAARITICLPNEKLPQTFEANLPLELEEQLTFLRSKK
jgi:23S rRNA pseudouridine1911/1915/1917 synthase